VIVHDASFAEKEDVSLFSAPLSMRAKHKTTVTNKINAIMIQ
jgi:hypothetical protein